MRFRSTGWLAVVAAIFAFATPATAFQRRAVGEFFPDVELPTIDGSETIRLSELEGQRLLLIEFASW